MATLDSGDHGTVKRLDSGERLPSAAVKNINSAAPVGESFAASANSLDELIGKTIDGRFRVTARLGKGGMSEVYKAEHLMLQKPLAVKVLHRAELLKANSTERFQQEAKAISTLDHPNIVKVYAFGASESSGLYLAMDFLDGQSLMEILEDEKQLDWKQVLKIALQIAAGLEHAHSRGVIHRDLKPSNVIVQKNDENGELQIKIVDFGVARLTSDSGKELKSLTLAGNTCGSPPYMSPEQCLGEPVDARSDVYSFGIMLYELLSGKRPFYAASSLDLMRKHLEQSPKFLSSACPGLEIPESLEAIVRKCLAKKPELRYQSMQELHDDLAIVGSESGLELQLCESLKNESDQCISLKERLLKNRFLPAFIIIAALAAAGFVFSKYWPLYELVQTKNEIAAINEMDPNKLDKLFVLIPKLIAQERKAGQKVNCVKPLDKLRKQVESLPISSIRGNYLLRLSQLYRENGREAEAQALVNDTLLVLEQYIENCKGEQSFGEVIRACKQVILICKGDPTLEDHMLGQYNRLVHIYVAQKKYKLAEKTARTALETLRSFNKSDETAEIVMLANLAETLVAQRNFEMAEKTLEQAYNSSLKRWGPKNPLTRHLAEEYLGCLHAAGKKQLASELQKTIALK